ncbi:MAG: DUF29 domain-containing protein [Nitrococcus sp.]|nr:DUF29 domain-containing protein [Nitrococcus sp.]
MTSTARFPAEHGERDYYEWLLETARAVRSGAWGQIDQDALAEELEDMGRSERRAVRSHLVVLLVHLLKWHYQSDQRSQIWRASISNARVAIDVVLEDSPSLNSDMPKYLPKAYEKARGAAADETGLPQSTFPKRCPWRLDLIMTQDPTALSSR